MPQDVWNTLHDDGGYNIGTVPLVLFEGAAQVGVTGPRLNYSGSELRSIFAPHDGTGLDAGQDGVEVVPDEAVSAPRTTAPGPRPARASTERR